jgi:hypothetical protein
MSGVEPLNRKVSGVMHVIGMNTQEGRGRFAREFGDEEFYCLPYIRNTSSSLAIWVKKFASDDRPSYHLK